MNAVTQVQSQRQIAPINAFRADLESMKPQFEVALPPHVSVDRFIRVLVTAVQATPALLNVEQKSLLQASMKCAQDGLLPDGREAALVIFGKQAQYMPMVAGILSKVRRSGELLSIAAHVVYERDNFRYLLGDNESIEHSPHLGADRGEPIAAYAVAKTKDGGIYREVMSVADINQVRDVSRSKNNGPWVAWWAEMAKKTVIRRLSKRLPMSTDLQAVIESVDDDYDFKAGRPQLGTPNLSARLAAPSTAPTEGFNANGLDPDDHIPDFDAEASPSDTASEQPAPDAPPPSGAGDTSSNEASATFDVLQWADKLIDDLPFLRPEQIAAIENDRKEMARFTLLKSTDMAKAQQLESAIHEARGA